jgi:hypothetical protein
LHDILRDLLKFGELLNVGNQHEAILKVLQDTEFIYGGAILRAQNISE